MTSSTSAIVKERLAKLKNYQNEIFDCLVVGGGITGSGVARDLAGRKISCLLVNKGDFASGTSSKSGKLIHGGLRYLRYGHVGMVLESCLERNRLLHILAPHIARPVAFILPFFKESKTPRFLAAIGLFIYDLLSLFKNTKNFEFLSKKECKILGKNFKYDTLVGGLRYWDSFCHDSRLVIETLKCASSQGAQLVNYCVAIGAKKVNDLWIIKVSCQLTEQCFEMRSKTLVNCAGPWCDDLEMTFFAKNSFHSQLTRGAHLLIDRKKLDLNDTISVEAPQDKRNIYFIPWQERILVGTTDKFFDGDKDDLKLVLEDKQYLLEVINYYFPTTNITEQDIKSFYVGIRPLSSGEEGQKEEQLSRDYKIICHEKGAVSISGGKLTTYRSMSKKIVDTLIGHFLPQYKNVSCQSLSPLKGAQNLKNCLTNRPSGFEKVWDLWCERYGSGVLDLYRIVLQNKTDDLKSFIADSTLTYAEILYFVQFEWAFNLEDIIFRRSTFFLLENKQDFKEIEELAAFLQKCLGLSDEIIKQQIINYKNKILI